MKNIKIYLFSLGLTIIYGCSQDRLDLYPLTEISEGTFYQDASQLEAAADDVYRQIGRLYNAFGIPSLYGTLFSDNGAVVAQLAGTPVDQPIDRHQLTADNPRVETAWDEAYNVIFICNNVIEQLEITQVEIDSNLKTRMLAEAKLVRALAYFNLVRAFGAVPLITEVITPSQAFEHLRESPDTIYQQIIDDLTLAKNDLPTSYSGSDIGRLTKYSASAILAKVHLTRNSMQPAQEELETIINSGMFSLDANGDGQVNVEDYYFLFLPNTKNSKSSILEAQYMAGPNAANSSHQIAFAPYLDAFKHPLIDGTISRGNGINTPTDDLAAEFEDADPRKDITAVPGFTNPSTGDFVGYPFTLKYFDPNWFNAGQNVEIIRYADILLMYAEVTGNSDYLNMVRARVGLPLYGSPEYPSNLYPTLALAIEHERRMELGLEFHRYFDLVRTGRAKEVLQSKVPGEVKLLFPIPLYAIDVNPGLTQNPGY